MTVAMVLRSACIARFNPFNASDVESTVRESIGVSRGITGATNNKRGDNMRIRSSFQPVWVFEGVEIQMMEGNDYSYGGTWYPVAYPETAKERKAVKAGGFVYCARRHRWVPSWVVM